MAGTTVRHARDRVLDIQHIRLEIAIDLEKKTIAGTAEHRATVISERLEAFSLDAVALTVDEVLIDGKPASFVNDGEHLLIRPTKPLERGSPCRVVTRFRGSPERGLYFIAPDAGYPQKPLQAWTQGQDEDARYWFPCYDYPNQKATTEVIVTVPAGFEAISNGRLVERREAGASTVFHWLQEVPHVTYLVTLVVGQFDIVEETSAPVPMRYLVPRGRGADARRTFGRTPAMMRRFAELFGHPFPYARYDQVVVSDFIFGGMENTSATTLFEYTMLDASVDGIMDRDDLIAHELAHQWFGDLVTCRDWSQAWLNEGFATFAESLWYETGDSRERARYHLFEEARRYFQEDAGEYRRPIVCRTYDAPTDLFDRHLYEKGACVLAQLRLDLGDEVFFRALGRYVQSHARGPVETIDLRRAIELECGRNLDAFFDQWVLKAGFPVIDIEQSYDATRRRLSLRVRQTQKVDAETPHFDFNVTCRAWLTGSQPKFVDRTFKVSGAENRFEWDLPADPRGLRFNHAGGLLIKLTFERPDGWLATQLVEDDDLLGRIEAAEALGRSGSARAIEALTQALGREATWMGRVEIARALGFAGTEAARRALRDALTQSDPRVRAAVAHALGQRNDADSAQALRRQLQTEKVGLVRGAIFRALGRTRAGFARELLAQGLDEPGGWNETVTRGALEGLVALRDPALDSVFRAEMRYGNHELRRAIAVGGLAEIGAALADKTPIRETLVDALQDRSYRLVMATIQALQTLGDVAASGPLEVLAQRRHIDGRIRRQARLSAQALRGEGQAKDLLREVNERLDRLETERRKLNDRLEKIEPAVPKTDAKTGRPKRPATKRPARKPPARKRRR